MVDIPRERARALGESALRAIREGWYSGPDGRLVDWRADVLVANQTTLGAARRLGDIRDSGRSPSTSPTGSCPGVAALLARRIRRLLAVARAYGFDALALGAWDCGAFGNDPVRRARGFRDALEGEFDGAFRHVTFAVTDWSADRRFLRPFRDAFSLED